MVISTAAKSRSTVLEANIYLSDISFGYFKIRHSTFQVFALDKESDKQTTNNNHNLQRVSWDLVEI